MAVTTSLIATLKNFEKYKKAGASLGNRFVMTESIYRDIHDYESCNQELMPSALYTPESDGDVIAEGSLQFLYCKAQTKVVC